MFPLLSRCFNAGVRALVAILVSVIILPFSVLGDVLVVAYMNESVVALIDGKTRKEIVKFATGRNPHEVRVSRDHRTAYVVAGRYITAVDLVARRAKKTFDLGEYSAHDIRISRDGKVFWAACAPSKAIVEVDVQSGKVIKTYDTTQEGSWFVEVSPDERTFYTPNLEGKSVSIIDRVSGSAQVIPLPAAGYGIDVSADGKRLWVSGGDLTVIDTASKQVIKTIKASESQTGRIRITADGKKVVVALAKRLAVYDAVTFGLIGETALEKEPKVLTVSRDGKYACLTNPADNSMTIVDIQDGKLLETVPVGKRPDGVAWAR